jgi:small subunit ribosomal protein S17
MQERRKKFEGVVVSTKMQKTAVVIVERLAKHPLLGKTMKLKKRFIVHDEKMEARVGDKVRIMECRPISKTKKFVIVENLTRQKSRGASNDTATDNVHSG